MSSEDESENESLPWLLPLAARLGGPGCGLCRPLCSADDPACSASLIVGKSSKLFDLAVVVWWFGGGGKRKFATGEINEEED